jgi:hypothetical protein
MKKIALFMAVCLLAFTEYAKAGKRLPRIATNAAESTSHVYFDDIPAGQYKAFLTESFVNQLSDEAFRNIFIISYDPSHPNHDEAKRAFTPGALNKYVYHLTYMFGDEFNVPKGELLTNEEVIEIMENTSFGPAPSDLISAYEVGRLTDNSNDKTVWFKRNPYTGEKAGSYKGKVWVLASCGNITRPAGGEEIRTSTRRTSPRTERDEDYEIINNNNVILRGGTEGRPTRDQRLDITIDNTRSPEMTDWEREDIRFKKKANDREWVNTGTRLLNTGLLAVNTFRGIRFEEQRTQHYQTSRVRSAPTNYSYNRSRTYDRGYRYRDEDFQGPSPSGRYANRSTMYDDEYYDEYYDDYNQGSGGYSNDWATRATRALSGDQYYEEDLRMYNRRGTNYGPSRGGYTRQASYGYGGRGRNNVLRN